ncbi:MAG: molecular chaperone GroEL [Bacillota bacterium]|nr:molecular chaperone GroEL [Bacillota bacterium]
MAKEIIYNESMRKKTMAGIDKISDAVKVTFGPKGRNVIMYQKANIRDADYSDRAQKGAHALVTNDGVTIAKSIVLPDEAENMGAQLLKEAASRTNEAAGDGTTATIVLAQAILKEGYKNVAAGAHPLLLRNGIKKASALVTEELKKMAKPITTKEEISRVAMVSCQDKALGDMIGEALDSVGLEGVLTIDETGKRETTLDIMEGITFERGFISSQMATDKEQTVAELYDPYILLCDKKFQNPQDLIPALIIAAEDGRDCLVISDGIEGEAMGLIMQNKREGEMNVVGVLAPLYGEGRRWRLEDMAVQTGGVFITEELGMDIRDIKAEMMGTAEYVKVTANRTIITGAGGDPKKIEKRVKELRHLIENTDYDFNRERHEERLAKFVSGIARLDIGGKTEPEIWERKMRAEDAVHAARAAYEEGVVPGGGVALLDTIPKLKAFTETLEGDEKIGAETLLKTLEAPVRQIAINAGADESAVVGNLIAKQQGTGYDAATDSYVPMLETGIADPVKVIRMSLEAAVSVAATLLTGEAEIYEKTVKREVFDARNIR